MVGTGRGSSKSDNQDSNLEIVDCDERGDCGKRNKCNCKGWEMIY